MTQEKNNINDIVKAREEFIKSVQDSICNLIDKFSYKPAVEEILTAAIIKAIIGVASSGCKSQEILKIRIKRLISTIEHETEEFIEYISHETHQEFMAQVFKNKDEEEKQQATH